MCGIFGYVSDKYIGITHLKELIEIGQFNVKRGNRAFGYLGISNHGFIIGRHDFEFDKSLRLSHLDDCNIVLFHLLSSTGTEKRIHPFETDQFIFAHNGLLLDYQSQYDYDYLGPTDSQYLLAAIDQQENHLNSRSKASVAEGIAYANEKFNGQRACWMWDKLDQVLYLWRVMSPLYIEIEAEHIIFSSVKFSDKCRSVPEGKIFGIKEMVLDHLADFDYYSPYYQGDK